MNKCDQKERASLLGSTGTTTFHAQSQIAQALDAPGGRFAVEDKSTVVGADPAIAYPVLPSSSPWSDARLPDEPPLGFSVNEMQPVGTFAEIEKSLGSISPVEREGESTSLEPSPDLAADPVPVASAGVVAGTPLAATTPDLSPAQHAALAQVIPRMVVKKWSPPKW